MTVFWLYVELMLALVLSAAALPFTTIQNGSWSWSNTDTWNPDAIADKYLPGSSNDVVSASGSRVVLDVSVNVRSIHVQRNATFTCPETRRYEDLRYTTSR